MIKTVRPLPFSSRAIPARLQGLRSHPGPWWRQHSGLSFRSIIRSCKDLQQTNRSEKIKTGIKQEIPTYSTIQNRLRLVSYIEKTCNFPIHASHLLTLFERWTEGYTATDHIPSRNIDSHRSQEQHTGPFLRTTLLRQKMGLGIGALKTCNSQTDRSDKFKPQTC